MEILPASAEGEAGLTVPLKEDAGALAAGEAQQHVLFLVGLDLKAGILQDGGESPPEHINLLIVESHRLPLPTQPREDVGPIGAVKGMSLPVDIVEAHLAVATTPVALVPTWREVGLALAIDLHLLESEVHLRRRSLQHEAGALAPILQAIHHRRVVPIQLEPRGHVSAEACREVQADEQWNGLPGLFQVQLSLAVHALVRTPPPPARELRELKVARRLAPSRHDPPDVEVDDRRLGVDRHLEPLP
mmetsp:Transcript_110781/g.320126  ORF Transcript_110781/g.320126 Transcript_110781/m.320126 type:complete len:246 (-) Transcript_110781:1018-1755(-)